MCRGNPSAGGSNDRLDVGFEGASTVEALAVAHGTASRAQRGSAGRRDCHWRAAEVVRNDFIAHVVRLVFLDDVASKGWTKRGGCAWW